MAVSMAIWPATAAGEGHEPALRPLASAGSTAEIAERAWPSSGPNC